MVYTEAKSESLGSHELNGEIGGICDLTSFKRYDALRKQREVELIRISMHDCGVLDCAFLPVHLEKPLQVKENWSVRLGQVGGEVRPTLT